MRLKSIEIIGFKSFADKVKIIVDLGITAIVGPNGCGKSNISDAFRWVLGEQSAKSMRGSKMPDVIFAGTSTRKPLNYAEVTITLTDVAGALPIDFEEVSITRKLHRSGESEYFINRQPVRLKDVQHLFLDSGIGKDAYSIFEQGKIDQIINLSTLERRYIFEEAAGILRFLQRKREALRKLEQTEQNVSRVKDIHQEVEKQIIVLEEQSKKAREYKENLKQVETLEKAIKVSKWDVLKIRFTDMSKKGEEIYSKIADVKAQLTLLQDENHKEKEAAHAKELAFRAQSEQVYKTRSEAEVKLKEKQALEEKLKEILVKEKRWERELEEMEERRLRREGERQGLLASQSTMSKRSSDLLKNLLTQQEKVKQLEEEVSVLRQKQQTGQREYLKRVQEENAAQRDVRESELRLENLLEKQATNKKKGESIVEIEKQLVASAEKQKALLEEVSVSIESQKGHFSTLEKDFTDLTEELEKSQERLDQINQELLSTRAREKVLLALQKEKEGFSSGSKKLLEESTNPNSSLFGKIKGLYEYFSPDKGVEAPIANVMRPYEQTLVVQTVEDYEAVISFCKERKMQDVSLLCVDVMRQLAGKHPSASGETLASRVQPNELSHHFLQGVEFSLENINLLTVYATAHAKSTKNAIAFVDGTMVDCHSVVFLGAPRDSNVFLRDAELKSLEKVANDLHASREQWATLVEALRQKLGAIQQERTELDKAIRKHEMRYVEVNFAFQKSMQERDKAKIEVKQLQGELVAISSAIEELKGAQNTLKESYLKAKEITTKLERETQDLGNELQTKTNALRQEGGRLKENEHSTQQQSDEQKKLIHSLHVLEVKDVEAAEQVKRLKEEIEIGKGTYLQVENRIETATVDLKKLEETLTKVARDCKELEERVCACKEALEKLQNKTREKQELLNKYEGEHAHMRLQSEQLQSHMDLLEGELKEQFNVSLQEVREGCKEVFALKPEGMEKQKKALKEMIGSLGDINMTAIEECDRQKTRYQFLGGQIDDLDLSKQELVTIIAELDGESRKIFKETFEIICHNFKKNFKILFNGGEADLKFTDTSDVLEAGIDIIAQPPGKQMRSIQLLSGGEKCLTAMALLFAIFEVKPSPFCILDEIDAPLDDTNVERFVNIVREFAHTCQFIIITHNKRTMAIADKLVGVSMEERGVSKLLAMDFSKSKHEVAAV